MAFKSGRNLSIIQFYFPFVSFFFYQAGSSLSDNIFFSSYEVVLFSQLAVQTDGNSSFSGNPEGRGTIESHVCPEQILSRGEQLLDCQTDCIKRHQGFPLKALP